MKENEILAEIHRVRAEHARECNYDVDTIFAEMREELKRLQAEGWKVVSPAPRKKETAYSLREEPRPKKSKDNNHENKSNHHCRHRTQGTQKWKSFDSFAL